MDCARSARRLGAKEVHLACLECREDMPAEASELAQGEEEGIRVHPSLTLTRIVGKSGKVAGVECVAVTGLQFDENGQPHFEVVKGSEQSLPADTVIFAIGQVPDLGGLAGDGGVEASQRGTIIADPETMMLGRRGVFAAGDCVTGVTSIIDAIASGQKAAFYINRYLQGDVLRVKPKKTVLAADIKVDIPADKEKQARQPMPLLAVKDRISNFKEVALGFSPEAAVEEAKRCLNCAGHLCKDVCPYGAPQFADEEKAKMQKCDLCVERWPAHQKPICVEACPVRALDAGSVDELRGKYGDVREAYGFVYSQVTEPAVTNKPKPKRR
jgi:ferredoxin